MKIILGLLLMLGNSLLYAQNFQAQIWSNNSEINFHTSLENLEKRLQSSKGLEDLKLILISIIEKVALACSEDQWLNIYHNLSFFIDKSPNFLSRELDEIARNLLNELLHEARERLKGNFQSVLKTKLFDTLENIKKSGSSQKKKSLPVTVRQASLPELQSILSKLVIEIQTAKNGQEWVTAYDQINAFIQNSPNHIARELDIIARRALNTPFPKVSR
jgi:hypothetical protein